MLRDSVFLTIDSAVKKKLHVIIIQKVPSLPEGLRQSLKTKGFGTTVVEEENEALKAVEKNADIVTLVYCAPEDDVSATLGNLVEIKGLPYPSDHHHR